jgi:hypothetical protein
MLQGGRSRVRFPMRSLNLSRYGPGVDSASNRNEYQKSSWGKGRPVRKANNLTSIYEPIVEKMWESRRLTNLWASEVCYRDSFTFLKHESHAKRRPQQFFVAAGTSLTSSNDRGTHRQTHKHMHPTILLLLCMYSLPR